MKKVKLSTILENFVVKTSGFPAVKELEKYGSKSGSEVVISTLPPHLLAEQGITEYLAPVFERGKVYQSAEEIVKDDIELGSYKILNKFSKEELEEKKKNTIIVSRHEGTVAILKKEYPNSDIFSSIEKEDVEGKHVIGTLPPHLVMYADLYTPVTIKDFDYVVDGDLTGNELKERLLIGSPIQLKPSDKFASLSSFFENFMAQFNK